MSEKKTLHQAAVEWRAALDDLGRVMAAEMGLDKLRVDLARLVRWVSRKR